MRNRLLAISAALATSLAAQQPTQTSATPAAQSNPAQAVQPQLTPEQIQLLVRFLQAQQNPGQVTPAPQPQTQQPHQPGQLSPANPKAQSECTQSGAQSSLTKTTITRSSRIPHSFWKPLGKICDKTGVCVDQTTFEAAKADAARKQEAERQACLAAQKALASPVASSTPATKQ
jgi:hypothetical protein